MKTEEKQEVWKWWEEEKGNSDEKWKFLEHKGPVFAPEYERVPKDVKFYYNGKQRYTFTYMPAFLVSGTCMPTWLVSKAGFGRYQCNRKNSEMSCSFS